MINAAGRKIIEDAEGLRLEAYICPAGKWTIGIGHTGDVKHGDKITQHQAEVILDLDLQIAEETVRKAVKVELNENQLSALISFVFNIGPGKPGVKDGFVYLSDGRPSSMLERINEARFLAAAEEFPKWVHANGVELPGLVKRRAAERALFLEVVPK